MRFPFVWRKTAEDEAQVWKAEASRQRRRAERAEGIARTEVFVRRRISAAYSALHDEHERALGRLTAAPVPNTRRPGGDADRARRAAARIAEVAGAARRARAYVAAASTTDEGVDS